MNFRAKLLFFFATTVVVSGILNACRQTLEAPQWDVDVLAPIASTTIGIEDIIQDSLIKSHLGNRLKLVYDENVFGFRLDSIFSIPDTTIVDELSLPPINLDIPPGADFVDKTEDTRYKLKDLQLVEALVREGAVKLNLKNNMDEGVIFTYEIPSATLNGVVFSLIKFVPAGESFSDSINLTDYILDLRGLDFNDFNTIITNVKATLNPSRTTDYSVKSSDNISVSSTFSGIVPEYAKGYFGNRLIELVDEGEPTDIFNNIKGGTFDIDEFTLTLGLKNGIGAEMLADINSVGLRDSNTNQQANLEHSLIGSQITLNRAAEVFHGGYPPIKYTYWETELNQNNSNLDEVLENLGNEFLFSANFQINPLGNVSNNNDFIYYNTGIDVFLRAEVPIRLSANKLILVDTTEFNFTQDGNRNGTLDDIENGILHLHASNGYPFDAEIQLYLLDSNANIIDSLSEIPATINAGTLNSSLIVEEKTISEVPFPVDNEKIDRLYETSDLIIQIKLTTDSQPDLLWIYDHYDIDLKLIGDFTYRMNSSDN